ncbi:MFS transporter [Streptomyces sp. QL37]|uniref:MFS transporter n=1 Tax=Streptomyces sp. QL37 TaxID=2093747 RepID=UPI000CF1D616|nr:MFS transporter [Streptomyces sp. QL37]PPQ56972.1 MFS transporter [Streptomyces sp. QL37]
MASVAVVRDRTARLCLTGLLVSGFGTSAMWLTAGIWVKSLTGSDSLAALTVCAMWAPVLVGPSLGAVADLVPRRLLLITVNLVMAGLMASLLLVGPDHRIGALFAVLLVYGVSGVLLDAAEAALVARAVDARLLGDFNGLRTTVNEGMKLLAPLAGAGLYARYGAVPVVALDAVTFALAALVFARLRVREPAGPARKRARRGGTAAGIRLLRGSAALRPLVYAGALTMLLAGFNGAAVYAVVETLGRPPAYAGVLYAFQGAGSVAVGLLAGPLLRRMPERGFAAAGIAVFAVAVGARALGGDAVALAASTAIGAGLPCVLIAAMTAVQRETPDAVLGRTAAAANSLMTVPNAVALAGGAGLVAVVDVRLLLALTALAGLVTAARLGSGRRVCRAGTEPS